MNSLRHKGSCEAGSKSFQTLPRTGKVNCDSVSESKIPNSKVILFHPRLLKLVIDQVCLYT